MQRKATKQSRAANSDEKAFQGWLKDQYCCITGIYGVDVHHCAGSTFKHNKVLIGHWFCLPLAPAVHHEYHSGTKAFKLRYGSQAENWAVIADKYEKDQGVTIPFEVRNAIMTCGK